MTERVLFVSSFYLHVTWMSVANYVTTSDKWHKHCSKGWKCIDIWSFQFSRIQVIRHCSAQEYHISWTCVQFGSCFVTYKQQYQLLLHDTVPSLSVSQYMSVAAVNTKPKKFWIQFIMNVWVLVDAHFPVLCSVYGIFPFSRVLNFIVTNPMVHGLL